MSDCRNMRARARSAPWSWLAFGLTGVVVLSACAKRPVVAAPEAPPLVVPVVPPRLVGPVVVEEDAPEPVEETAAAPAARTPPRTPRVNRGNSEGSTASKPVEPAGPETSRPTNTSESAAPAAEAPAPLLRTPETADEQEAIRRVQAILRRAEQNLSRVNYKTLSIDAKARHDEVTRFIAQAEDALKTRSFTIARYFAGKAETLSGSLPNR
jgi:hypothetical protein